jgi:hypothetical protein
MLLSDNVSCVLQVPTIKTLSSLEEVKDPSFPFDVKLHFRQRPDHWKEVQKFRFKNKIHYTRDAETEYVKHKIELLNNDLSLYLRKYPDVDEAFQAFYKSMKGYVLTYGEELIRRALQRLK